MAQQDEAGQEMEAATTSDGPPHRILTTEWSWTNPIETEWLNYVGLIEHDPTRAAERDVFFAGASWGLRMAESRRDKRFRKIMEAASAEYSRWLHGLPPPPVESETIDEAYARVKQEVAASKASNGKA